MTIKELFFEETENSMLQFFRYVFVGGIAFVGDWGSLWLSKTLGANLYLAVAISFIVGLTINYILSKLFVFKKEYKSKVVEFIVFAVIGLIGLGLTELLMHVLSIKLNLHYLIAKIIVAAIVLVWNFLARKIILYRK